MRRAAREVGRPSRPPVWALAVVLLSAAGAILAIAVLARQRTEHRLAAAAVASAQDRPPPELQAETPPEDEPDPLLERLLAAAEPADASVAALDAATHALLVRDFFEEAEPLALRALAVDPQDAEATIHRAVLRGVAGDTAGARSELQRLAGGPAGWEASLFTAGFALRDGDDRAALRALRRFQAEAPPREVNAELLAEIAELEARLASWPENKK